MLFVLVPCVLVSAEDFVVVQMCDTQLGMGGYAHDVDSFEKAVVQINKMAPDLVVICGDLVNDADEKSFNDFKRIRAGFTVPCHVASGNHDVENVPTAESLAKYRAAIGEDYFTVDHKGYTFVIVNTQLWKVEVPEESAKHQAWFEKTLAELASRDRKSVIVGHYPLFLKTPDEAEEYFNIPPELRSELLGLLVKHGVVVFMAGHVHKNLLLEYEGIPMIASASGALNLDKSPLGFRVWKLGDDGPISHEFVRIEGLDPALAPKKRERAKRN
ncbi:MAG: metallophosphoesterase [Candidatus Hydrogenedentota bacterium]